MKRSEWLTRDKIRENEESTDLLKNFSRTLEHILPRLKYDLLEVKDTREEEKIKYKSNLLLLERILMALSGIESMNAMTRKFNSKNVIYNLNQLLNSNYEEIPHYTTMNNYLGKVETSDLEKVREKIIKELIRKKYFYDYRYMDKKWKVAIDGTGIYTFEERHCEHCLTKTYNKGTEKEKTIYFHYVLEAKLIIGDMAFSMASEFIENPSTAFEKQDCELKAFYRLEKKIKKAYPRLGICLIVDSLYANREVLKICQKNKWEYIIRFEAGSIPTLAEDFEGMKKCKEMTTLDNRDKYVYFNDIEYDKYYLNMIEYKALDFECPFVYIVSTKVTDKNCIEIVDAGRSRWKIENQGFNNQKHHGFYLEHVFCNNYVAMKNHYILIQIAHIILQLMQKGMRIFKEYKKALKDISYDILEALRNTQLTPNIECAKRLKINFKNTS